MKGVLGGPVVVTPDPAARSWASQKPLQMHPAWKPLVPHRNIKGSEQRGTGGRVGRRGRGAAVFTDTKAARPLKPPTQGSVLYTLTKRFNVCNTQEVSFVTMRLTYILFKILTYSSKKKN